MRQTFLFFPLLVAVIATAYFYYRHAAQRERERLADRRAMMEYLSYREDEYKGFQNL